MLDQESLELLGESVGRVLRERYDFPAYQRIRNSEAGWSGQLWREFAELGWMGLTVPEDHGGLGASPAQCLTLYERLGAALVLEPLLPTLIVADDIVRAIRGPAAREAFATGLLKGSVRLALASRRGQGLLGYTAVNDGGAYRLEGVHPAVLAAPLATHLLVPARLKGEVAMFLVPQTAAGVEISPVRLIDGRWSGIVRLNTEVGADSLLSRDGAWSERVEDLVVAGCAAEAVGLLQRALEVSVDYLKVRKQFAQPLAAFQAVRHAMAEVYVVVEQLRSLLKAVGEGLERPGGERTRLISAAMGYLGTAGYAALERCIQFHGGIGLTEEYPVGHYYKRLLVVGSAYGSAPEHFQRMAQLTSAETAAA